MKKSEYYKSLAKKDLTLVNYVFGLTAIVLTTVAIMDTNDQTNSDLFVFLDTLLPILIAMIFLVILHYIYSLGANLYWLNRGD